ncbi:MAG: apolipoprotein N-acyltransferase, partial [Bifidobacteriaceae bacterium]|nr:apolipoprotein N-acyltransferase [Bifidobacteriaceae bacterium]
DIGEYVKQHPVPFGEYVPFRSLARRVTPLVNEVAVDMLPGHGVGLLKLPSKRLGRTVGIGDVICFEVGWDKLVRESVEAGAEVLVVQTNNASFGHSDESAQQLQMVRLRAIETGRSAIQASTTGVSAVVSPTGVVSGTTRLWTAANIVASLPLRQGLTPAVRYGLEIKLVVCAFGAGLALIGFGGALRNRRPRRPRRAGRAT